MKILSIGNSFSQDAQRYLHELAKAEGVDIQTQNLYIGGCSLETHYQNMKGDLMEYELERNGRGTTEKTSIRIALESEDWDVITVQQASHFSWNFETYLPYIVELVEYVRALCPKVKIYIHETWPYENGSERLNSVNFNTSAEMYAALKKCYEQAFALVKADGIIRCGTAIMEAINRGLTIHKDTFHAGVGAGRYMLALVWYKTLTGNDISNNQFNDFDEPVSSFERKAVIEIANTVV